MKYEFSYDFKRGDGVRLISAANEFEADEPMSREKFEELLISWVKKINPDYTEIELRRFAQIHEYDTDDKPLKLRATFEFEAPESCYDCPLISDYSDCIVYRHLDENRYEYEYDVHTYDDSRAPFCPLRIEEEVEESKCPIV